MKSSTKITLAIVGGSFLLHLAAWSFVGLIKGERKREIVAIALAETKKKEEKKKDPPKPPDVKPEKAKVVQPKTKAPEPVPEIAPPPEVKAASNMNSYADLGLGAMGGGTGGNGIALPAGGGGGGGGGGPAPTATATQRHVALTPSAECGEDLVKPKLDRMIRPAYTQEGRQANVEGVVKLEITVDASGHVVGVKVLKGLGYGLDEAAMSTVRNQWTFAPATRCGKAVPATIKASVSFGLT